MCKMRPIPLAVLARATTSKSDLMTRTLYSTAAAPATIGGFPYCCPSVDLLRTTRPTSSSARCSRANRRPAKPCLAARLACARRPGNSEAAIVCTTFLEPGRGIEIKGTPIPRPGSKNGWSRERRLGIRTAKAPPYLCYCRVQTSLADRFPHERHPLDPPRCSKRTKRDSRAGRRFGRASRYGGPECVNMFETVFE